MGCHGAGPAALPSGRSNVPYWPVLGFELLSYIKRNHKKYLEARKHRETQRSFRCPPTGEGDWCPADGDKQPSRPTGHSLLQSGPPGCPWSRTWGGASTQRGAFTAIAGFSSCPREMDAPCMGLAGVFKVFVDGWTRAILFGTLRIYYLKV